jgi:hypothetical protein
VTRVSSCYFLLEIYRLTVASLVYWCYWRLSMGMGSLHLNYSCSSIVFLLLKMCFDYVVVHRR